MKKGKQGTNHGVYPTVMAKWRRGIGLVCLVLAAAIVSPAQDAQPSPNAVAFKTLVNFDGANGFEVYAALVQGTDANLNGTSTLGGAPGYCPHPSPSGCGTVFQMTPSGTLTTVYSFCTQKNCPDGYSPNYILALAPDGTFYGTTQAGGATSGVSGGCLTIGCGTIFQVAPDGFQSTLRSFCSQPFCTDGTFNYGGLVRASDGNFYGTTITRIEAEKSNLPPG